MTSPDDAKPKPAKSEVTPPVMRREERQEPDGRRLLLYHFDRPTSATTKKEPADG